jgi:hypothetical protein
MKHFTLILLLSITIISCKSPEVVTPSTPPTTTPVVTTTIKITQPTKNDIFPNSVTLKGEVSIPQNETIIARGFSWSLTNSNPTVNDNLISLGVTNGQFETSISGIKPNTTVYYNSYFKNSKTTSYSSVVKTNTSSLVYKPEWDNIYGDQWNSDSPRGIKLKDGSFIINSYKPSGSDIYGTPRMFSEYYVVKTSSLGQIEWEKTFPKNTILSTFCETTDGNIVFLSANPLNPKNAVFNKIDKKGNLLVEKVINIEILLAFNSKLIKGNDGGYIFLTIKSTGSFGKTDLQLIKIDDSGNLIWEKPYGGSENENQTSIISNNNNGYLILSNSNSTISGNKTSRLNGTGFGDIWVLMIDNNGTVIWDKSLGGLENDSSGNIIVDKDGNIYVGGTSVYSISTTETKSNMGYNPGRSDYYIVKLNNKGEKLWDKIIGSSLGENLYDLSFWGNDKIVLVGRNDSGESNDKFEPNYGGNDIWLVGINTNGLKLFEKNIGGRYSENSPTILDINDNKFTILSTSESPKSEFKTKDPILWTGSIKSKSDIWLFSFSLNY